jgi:hypothetical protein
MLQLAATLANQRSGIHDFRLACTQGSGTLHQGGVSGGAVLLGGSSSLSRQQRALGLRLAPAGRVLQELLLGRHVPDSTAPPLITRRSELDAWLLNGGGRRS